MKEFLTEGIVGNIEYNAQKQIRESIQNRWDSLGFTEGLPDGIKENVAIGHMIPAGTGIKNYKNVKLFDGSDKDLDIQMEEILERRRLEKEAEQNIPMEPVFEGDEND